MTAKLKHSFCFSLIKDFFLRFNHFTPEKKRKVSEGKGEPWKKGSDTIVFFSQQKGDT
jgi:hypothetical protein